MKLYVRLGWYRALVEGGHGDPGDLLAVPVLLAPGRRDPDILPAARPLSSPSSSSSSAGRLLAGAQRVDRLGPVGGRVDPMAGEVVEDVLGQLLALCGQPVLDLALVGKEDLLHPLEDKLVRLDVPVQLLLGPRRVGPPRRGGVGAGHRAGVAAGRSRRGRGGPAVPHGRLKLILRDAWPRARPRGRG